MAPSYTSQARKGKKVMPMPHNKQTKKASAPAEFGRQLGESCFQKQALGGLGTLVGAGVGTANAPKGNKMEGLGRGVGQGLGWDVGGTLGANVGAGAGTIGGLSLIALLETLTEQRLGQGAQNGVMGLGAASGAGAGYLGGGFLGKHLAKGMMGNPSWQNKDKTQGDAQADTAQMTAP
jgi:hypothetical protein